MFSVTLFIVIEKVPEIGLIIVPIYNEIGSVKDLTQLVSDHIDNGLKVQFGSQSLLDGVDDLQFADALLQLLGSLFDLALEFFQQTGIIQCDGGLIRQHAKHVAVGLVERAVEGGHVHVEVAEDLILGDERGDNSTESRG